ncbi:MAG: gfo/Idh/MocA family oxidoreductase, partial [Hymenobacteraceae bacterium]|nr:gfo/Idh/MocA family oxidoreductase [Hymenobacteraceae bacterium]
MHKRLRLGMIGGGQGAFIGAIHRIAAQLDGEYELVCGAFSSDPDKSRASGALLGLSPDRVYGSYQDLYKQELQLPEEERVQV